MSLALMLVLQAAVPPPPPAPLVAPIDFDLARYRPSDAGFAATSRACRSGDPDAIVVCGRRSPGTYPLDEMAAVFEPRPLVAEIRLIGNLRARAFVEAVELAPGVVSNRLMVGIRLPF
jgi:hypothetical protein